MNARAEAQAVRKETCIPYQVLVPGGRSMIHFRSSSHHTAEKYHSRAFGRIEPAVWLISNCFSSEYFFLDILKLEKRIFSRLATRAAGSILHSARGTRTYTCSFSYSSALGKAHRGKINSFLPLCRHARCRLIVEG